MTVNRSKLIGFLLILLIVIGIILIIYVSFRGTSKNTTPVSTSKYSQSIQKVIDNPIEINESWKTLERTEEYEISYSSDGDMDSFYITINAQPVLQVSLKAEQSFLKKLGIDERTACALPVNMGVPSAIDNNLSGYTFGFSFCFGKTHIEDVVQN